jgi:riboflavin kinase/FMN adenylyltransferase
VNVVHDAERLERVPRAVAIGTFDGVHLGHRAVIRAAVDAGLRPTVVTFDPHPRFVLGRSVELLASVQRRMELLADCGVEDVLVVPFTAELAALDAEAFARAYLVGIGAEIVVAGSGFRFGRERAGDLALLERLGLETRTVPLVEGISSTRIRSLIAGGDVEHAALLLGRPENLLVPANGIYAGAAGDARAAISIGVNPHFGGGERRVEAFLLDWSGDLYGERLVVQVWRRLRDERAFASDDDLAAQIARDVEATRAATRPV